VCVCVRTKKTHFTSAHVLPTSRRSAQKTH
jgi:hypothetical protein